jgi:cell division protease FtsH
MLRRKGYSEFTAQEIDQEVKAIITACYNKASSMIEEHKDKLRMIAECLLEYETLDGAQVEEIVRTGRFTPPPPSVANLEPPSGAQAATPLPEVVKPMPPKLPGLGSTAPAPVG